MIVFESHRSRRLLLRLTRGETLGAALGALAETHGVAAGWVRVTGTCVWCEIVTGPERGTKVRRFSSPATILGAHGSLSVHRGAPLASVFGTVSRETEVGIQLVGGRLVDFGALECELEIDCFDDIALLKADRPGGAGDPVLVTEPDGKLEELPAEAPGPGARLPDDDRIGSLGAIDPAGLADRDGAVGTSHRSGMGEPDRDVESLSTGGVSWAQAAMVSAKAAERPPTRRTESRVRSSTSSDNEDFSFAFVKDPLPEPRRLTAEELFSEPIPERGDYVEHKQFGLCRVDREDDDGGIVIRLPSGVRKTIKLDFLEVLPARIEGDRRIYPLRPRGRR